MSNARSRTVLILPDLGPHGDHHRGRLPTDHAMLRQADELRTKLGLTPLSKLDGPQVLPINAWALGYLVGLLHAESARQDHETVAVLASSRGWCTALAAAGVLSFADGLRIVHEMALAEQAALAGAAHGGQVIYPLTDTAWRPDATLQAAVHAALIAAHGQAQSSIELGGYAVLAGSERGVESLLTSLAPMPVGARHYPLRLALRGPHHSSFAPVIEEPARQAIAHLDWNAPQTTLIDGFGMRHTPWSTDPAELRDYTLDELPTATYRFATSLHVALREYAPEMLILPGPGRSLAPICGQVMVAEGYAGLRSRQAFEAAQRHSPIILSMDR